MAELSDRINLSSLLKDIPLWLAHLLYNCSSSAAYIRLMAAFTSILKKYRREEKDNAF